MHILSLVMLKEGMWEMKPIDIIVAIDKNKPFSEFDFLEICKYCISEMNEPATLFKLEAYLKKVCDCERN